MTPFSRVSPGRGSEHLVGLVAALMTCKACPVALSRLQRLTCLALHTGVSAPNPTTWESLDRTKRVNGAQPPFTHMDSFAEACRLWYTCLRGAE